MPPFSSQSALPLPRRWHNVTREGVLQAISVAAIAMTSAWSRASRSSRQRSLAEVDRLRSENALLTEELDLEDSRWVRVSARRRPYYGPVQRMRILELRGWKPTPQDRAHHFTPLGAPGRNVIATSPSTASNSTRSSSSVSTRWLSIVRGFLIQESLRSGHQRLLLFG